PAPDAATAAPPVAPVAPVAAPPSAGLLITQPVRGGQVVFSPTDLVVVGPVNAGAEVIADGNIHVYGRLSGRALAGAHGDEEARIFCSHLDAELVSVAGEYRRADELSPEQRGKPVQIFLGANGSLVIADL
ncbi:MAG: septum site-determining protein MinC, partial [Myxococcales bacterium]|nr:septum site-determining protein MinC [Myxococcales bacterium]